VFGHQDRRTNTFRQKYSSVMHASCRKGTHKCECPAISHRLRQLLRVECRIRRLRRSCENPSAECGAGGRARLKEWAQTEHCSTLPLLIPCPLFSIHHSSWRPVTRVLPWVQDIFFPCLSNPPDYLLSIPVSPHQSRDWPIQRRQPPTEPRNPSRPLLSPQTRGSQQCALLG